jgi:hypothetical protein
MKPTPHKRISLRLAAATDVRASARGLRLPGHPLATAIRVRYANSRRLGPWLNLVLRRQPLQRAWQPRQASTTLAITSRLFLSLIDPSDRPVNERLSTRTGLSEPKWPTARQRAAHPMSPADTIEHTVIDREVHRTLLERLVSREIRREIGSHWLDQAPAFRSNALPVAAEGKHPECEPLQYPVKRILRRQIPAASVDSPPTSEPQLPSAPAIRNAVAGKLPEALPHALLSRITDHVIETIDHRVTAGRERRGRR